MKTVYFNEYNISMADISYLPLVSGLLQANAQQDQLIRESYKFMPFIYKMARPDEILAQYTESPDVAAFSSVSWNEQLNYTIAEAIKNKYPMCQIIFGGPNVPMPPQHDIGEWMDNHPFVDVAVRAEGEEAFADILVQVLDDFDFRYIPGVASRDDDGEIIFCDEERPFKRNLSELPSPYLDGLYDDLIDSGKQFTAIIETNRGCPFPCTFCYWGRGGLSRKYKYHDLERVYAEIDWMGRNKIRYLFNADSNLGMNKRDGEIIDFLIETKKKYGYPEKFRTCFGKNTDEKIYSIAKSLYENKLEKGITLSRQSNDETTLKNVRRENIKLDSYRKLQERFVNDGVPTYTDLILGMPGETYESWKRGVDEIIEAGPSNHLLIYPCQLFANTEMAEKAYIDKFQIKTKRIKLAEIHGGVRPADWVQEYEEIVISTYSMTTNDWRAMMRFSYTLMTFHSLKLAYFIMVYLLDEYGIKMSDFIAFISERRFTAEAPLIRAELDIFDVILWSMLANGEHRGTFMPEYSDFYWDVEEASFLRLTQSPRYGWNIDLCLELRDITHEFVGRTYGDAWEKLAAVMLYNWERGASQSQLSREPSKREWTFQYNIPEYFDKRFGSNRVPLVKKPQAMEVTCGNYDGDKKIFARDTILWGRKSGAMLLPCTWRDA